MKQLKDTICYHCGQPVVYDTDRTEVEINEVYQDFHNWCVQPHFEGQEDIPDEPVVINESAPFSLVVAVFIAFVVSLMVILDITRGIIGLFN